MCERCHWRGTTRANPVVVPTHAYHQPFFYLLVIPGNPTLSPEIARVGHSEWCGTIGWGGVEDSKEEGRGTGQGTDTGQSILRDTVQSQRMPPSKPPDRTQLRPLFPDGNLFRDTVYRTEPVRNTFHATQRNTSSASRDASTFPAPSQAPSASASPAPAPHTTTIDPDDPEVHP
ncbi:hypothetical protein RHS01_07271 [Rhizoctonia solani]|uniref:Uncharacterized protein n=1 Tax=Rhizoctonia solani TaxID=456999 RepID=A0A8H7I7N1_9AGAM|nr:hypothetical protein RHS01_07271 [Rhizoctonia solani]